MFTTVQQKDGYSDQLPEFVVVHFYRGYLICYDQDKCYEARTICQTFRKNKNHNSYTIEQLGMIGRRREEGKM